jgi:outer membrane murein-binding lipoprotein Lpp
MFESAKDGKADSYNEFYMNWLNHLEGNMTEIFKGDEFSKLQGEVLALQLDLKTNFSKGMEQVLSPYPVALNSEIDELAKQVHALKARIRELENNAEATSTAKKSETETKAEAKPAVAKATTAKTATTKKATSK